MEQNLPFIRVDSFGWSHLLKDKTPEISSYFNYISGRAKINNFKERIKITPLSIRDILTSDLK